jgi:group I intron endonuclease
MRKNKICAIYMIRNKINNKLYIGCAVDYKRRFIEHKSKLKLNKHYNNYLQRNWNKYGGENFEYIIIEICEKCQLKQKEILWIKYYRSDNSFYGFNGTKGGDGSLGHIVSEVSRRKMSEKAKGRIVSEETRKNISESHKGIISHAIPHSEETKIKISKSKKGKPIAKRKIPKTEEERERISKSQRGIKTNGKTTSKYVGVYQDKKGVWIANIKYKGKSTYIGRYKTEIEAAIAYNLKAIELYGPDTRINIIEESNNE